MAELNIGLSAQQFLSGMEKVRQSLQNAANAVSALQKSVGTIGPSMDKAAQAATAQAAAQAKVNKTYKTSIAIFNKNLTLFKRLEASQANAARAAQLRPALLKSVSVAQQAIAEERIRLEEKARMAALKAATDEVLAKSEALNKLLILGEKGTAAYIAEEKRRTFQKKIEVKKRLNAEIEAEKLAEKVRKAYALITPTVVTGGRDRPETAPAGRFLDPVSGLTTGVDPALYEKRRQLQLKFLQDQEKAIRAYNEKVVAISRETAANQKKLIKDVFLESLEVNNEILKKKVESDAAQVASERKKTAELRAFQKLQANLGFAIGGKFVPGPERKSQFTDPVLGASGKAAVDPEIYEKRRQLQLKFLQAQESDIAAYNARINALEANAARTRAAFLGKVFVETLKVNSEITRRKIQDDAEQIASEKRKTAEILEQRKLQANLGFQGGGRFVPGPDRPSAQRQALLGSFESIETKKARALRSFGQAEVAQRLQVLNEIVKLESASAARQIQIAEETSRKRIAARRRAAQVFITGNQETVRGIKKVKDEGDKLFKALVEGAKDLARITGIALFIGAAFELQQALRDSIILAGDFSRAIAEIQTISDSVGVSTAEWGTRLTALSSQFGISVLDQAEAAYQAISNQVLKTSNDFEILEAANQLAVTAVTDTSTAVNLLSSALNAYRRPATDAQEISAQLFKTVELGRLRISEISDIFGRVAVGANQLGISLEETNAAIATLTIQGLQANEAITLINNVIQKLIRPGQELKDVLNQIGFASSQAALQALGFGGLLARLQTVTGDSVEKVGALFQRIRAIRGALGFAGQGLEIFNNNLKEISDVTLTDFASRTATILESPGQRLRIQGERIKNFFVAEFGQAALTAILEIGDAFGGFDRLIKSILNPVRVLGEAIGTLARFTRDTVGAVIPLKTAFTALGVAAQVAAFTALAKAILFTSSVMVGRLIPAALSTAGTLFSLTAATNAYNASLIAHKSLSLAQILNMNVLAIKLKNVTGILKAVRSAVVAWSTSFGPLTIGLAALGLLAPKIGTILGELGVDLGSPIESLDRLEFKFAGVFGLKSQIRLRDFGKLARETTDSLIKTFSEANDALEKTQNRSVQQTLASVSNELAEARSLTTSNLSRIEKSFEDTSESLETLGKDALKGQREELAKLEARFEKARENARIASREVTRLNKQIANRSLQVSIDLGLTDETFLALNQKIERLGSDLDEAFRSENAASFAENASAQFNAIRAQAKETEKFLKGQLDVENQIIDAESRRVTAVRLRDREGRKAIDRELERLKFVKENASRFAPEELALREKLLQAEQNLTLAVQRRSLATPANLRTSREDVTRAREEVRRIKGQLEARVSFESQRKTLRDQETSALQELSDLSQDLATKTQSTRDSLRENRDTLKQNISAFRELLTTVSSLDLDAVFAAGSAKEVTAEVEKQIKLFGDLRDISNQLGEKEVGKAARDQVVSLTGAEVEKILQLEIDNSQEIANRRAKALRERIAEERKASDALNKRANTLRETLAAARDEFRELGREGNARAGIVAEQLTPLVRELNRLIARGGNVDASELKALEKSSEYALTILESLGGAVGQSSEFRVGIEKAKTALEGFRESVVSTSGTFDSLLKQLADRQKAIDLTAERTKNLGNLPFGGFALGGSVRGPAGGDRIPAMLSAGEFVVNRMAAQRFSSMLTGMNNGTIRPGSREFSSDTNVGGITVTVNESGNPQRTARAVVDEINRGLRQGTIELKSNRR